MTNVLRLLDEQPEVVPLPAEINPSIIEAIYGGCQDCESWSYALDLLKTCLSIDFGVISLGAGRAAGAGKIVVSSGADAAKVRGALAAMTFGRRPDGLIQSRDMELPDGETSVLFFDFEVPEKGATMRVCLLRDGPDWPFSKAERSFVQLYVPAFRKAFELYVVVASQRYALEDYRQTAEKLRVTILTIGEGMRVLHKSGALDTIFGHDRDFGIDPHNRFYLNDAGQNDKLKRHVEQAARTVCHSLDQTRHVLMLPSGTANGWWSILCKRMHEDVFAGGELGPCVKLYIRFVPSLLQITPDLICPAMGLTPRQAEVAAGIVNGMNIETIAGDMGISRNTVRVHVAAIYARTAVRSRSEFTLLALRRLNNGWC